MMILGECESNDTGQTMTKSRTISAQLQNRGAHDSWYWPSKTIRTNMLKPLERHMHEHMMNFSRQMESINIKYKNHKLVLVQTARSYKTWK